jgi:hypothetical protein
MRELNFAGWCFSPLRGVCGKEFYEKSLWKRFGRKKATKNAAPYAWKATTFAATEI